MTDININPAKATREINNIKYVLTKIDFNAEDVSADEEYHKKKGREVKTIEEDGFYLLYTRIGQ